MQLLLEGSVGKSEDSQGRPKNSEPSGETGSSEDAQKRRLLTAARQKRWRQKHKESVKRQKRRYYWRHRERMIRNRKERYFKEHGPRKKIHGRTISEKIERKSAYDAQRIAALLSNPETAEEYRAKKKAYMARWMEGLKSDPERLAEFNKKIRTRRRLRFRTNPELRVKSRAATRAWQDANRDRVMQYQTNRYRNNPQVNLAVRARNGVRRALRYGGIKRPCRTIELLGCSWGDFVAHTERLFLPGMTWDNMHLWEIDHVKALSKWNLTDPVQLAAACNFRNLAPLWAEDNARKGNRDPISQPACVPASEPALSTP